MIRFKFYQLVLFLLPLTVWCQLSKKPRSIEDSLKSELVRVNSLLKSEKEQGDRLMYLLTAKEMALRSVELKDSVFQALVAIQAYNFTKDHEGNLADIDIYNALLEALKRFKDPMMKNWSLKVDKTGNEISIRAKAVVSVLCSNVNRNMKIDEWNVFSSHLPYERTCK